MKKNIIVISVLISIFFMSCSWFKDDKEKFINAYKEVLIIRSYYNDTASANPKIREALAKYGYTEAKF